MRLRNTGSVVRPGALWRIFLVLGAVSAQVARAGQPCADLMNLDTCRPAPAGADEKSAALRSLPQEGEVTQLSEGDRRKLRDLNPILRLQAREGVYEVKVISVPQAWTGLYQRAVLLISLPALWLLDSEELQALVAHEIGHEYVWQEYAIAQQRKDQMRLRKLELACDRIAVLTLERVGVKPTRLISALEKVSQFNRSQFGQAANKSYYPSLKTRRNLIKSMSRTKISFNVSQRAGKPKTYGITGSSICDASAREQ
jgi:Zn-dependent protease with chaperone function